MRLSDFTRLAGVTTRQVRHYQQEGLLPSPLGPDGFEPWMVGLARRVAFLVDLGFTTPEVRGFLNRIAERPAELGLPSPFNPPAHALHVERIDIAIKEMEGRRAELIELLFGEP